MKFSVVYADPPWGDGVGILEGSGEEGSFDPLILDSVMSLPVGEQVTKDALLFLCVPTSLLPVGLAVLEAWGFRYEYLWSWVVDYESGGFRYRGQCKQLLVGVRGEVDMSILRRHNLFDVFVDGEHQPERFRDLAEEAAFLLFGRCGKLDLFGSYWKIRFPAYEAGDWALWEEELYAGHGDGEF